MKFVIIGLSVTSSWGNGHATTYRALLRELAALGHQILFLEHDVPYYAKHRDMPEPPFCELQLYTSVNDLKNNYSKAVAEADVVIVGSYVQSGVEVGEWVISTAQGITAFYDIDTPVTLAKLEKGDFEYLHPDLISKYDLYLSFSGGPILKHLENNYGSPRARALYCSVDPQLYYPEETKNCWQMGYLGTYSDDRQPTVERLLNKAASKYSHEVFIVAGPQYPADYPWSSNVKRIAHLPPADHRHFYNTQKYTLNVTRADMIKAGYSPSVRLFEAAACGVPVISDYWEGIETFYNPGTELLIAENTEQVLNYFKKIDEEERRQIGKNARAKVLKYHTAAVRAKELEAAVNEVHQLLKV
tara:strand:+ start:4875 stop:5948 length:1074 start_codon:yes stop_codon:yes gene_type:complete